MTFFVGKEIPLDGQNEIVIGVLAYIGVFACTTAPPCGEKALVNFF